MAFMNISLVTAFRDIMNEDIDGILPGYQAMIEGDEVPRDVKETMLQKVARRYPLVMKRKEYQDMVRMVKEWSR
jgi:hypothetical protein